ncbi:MAG: Na(+)-translocating NADH-quinone reductase subunit C [Myxococcota bacterium]
MEHSSRYIVGFAAAVCGVCSIFVATAAVSLKDRQELNAQLDVQKKVLELVGLMEPGASLETEEIQTLYRDSIEARVVNLATGSIVEDVDPALFDQRAAAADPDTSREAPPNQAKVRRVPEQGLVYLLREDGQIKTLVFPVEGKGLWSTLYGFLALESDARTVAGITFYEHGETPGLGGEVDNPRWKALWKGRKAFDEQWQVALKVKKGAAGPVEADPYQVDGLSGATITSRGVSGLVSFWLGREGYGSYLEQYRSERGI